MDIFQIQIIIPILIVAVFFAIILVLGVRKKHTNLQEQLQLQANIINELKAQLAGLHQQWLAEKGKILEPVLENEQVTKQLNHRTKTLQNELDHFKQALEQLSSQQPEDKLYTRAKKMIALGADAEELVSECGLPRAEAELLISIHIKQQS